MQLLKQGVLRVLLCVCAVPARRLAATGPVVCMSVLSMPPHHYLLVVHEGSGAAVWDLRAQLIVAVLGHSSGDTVGVSANGGSSSSRPAAITAATWLPGSSKGDFATGHEDGTVCIWDMPPSAGSSASSSVSNGPSTQSKLPGDVLQQQHKLQAQLVSQLQGSSSARSGGSPKKRAGRSSRAGPRYRPVKSLEFVAGTVECLAVFGGNEVDRPDGLTLLPLPEPAQVCVPARWLTWQSAVAPAAAAVACRVAPCGGPSSSGSGLSCGKVRLSQQQPQWPVVWQSAVVPATAAVACCVAECGCPSNRRSGLLCIKVQLSQQQPQ
jgi:hypothetical protein